MLTTAKVGTGQSLELRTHFPLWVIGTGLLKVSPPLSDVHDREDGMKHCNLELDPALRRRLWKS